MFAVPSVSRLVRWRDVPRNAMLWHRKIVPENRKSVQYRGFILTLHWRHGKRNFRLCGFIGHDIIEPFRIARRSPRPDDVVIDILYCGVCHTDIHITRNEWGRSIYPVVPGHEIVGRVAQVGEGVSRFAPGDTVGVGGLGHIGLKLAKAFGADVTLFTRSAGKEAEARKLGGRPCHPLDRPGTDAGRQSHIRLHSRYSAERA